MATNNYFSNVAQKALNNMNPKNAFSGYSSFFKQPTTGSAQTPAPAQAPAPQQAPLPKNMNSSNTIYSSQNEPIASKAPVVKKTGYSSGSSKGLAGGGNTSGGSTFPVNNKQTPAPTTAPKAAQYTPQSYADYYQGKGDLSPQEQTLINQQQDIGSKYGQVAQANRSVSGPAGLINRISDADLARYQTELGANQSALTGLQSGLTRGAGVGQGLLNASLPRTVGPTDFAYNPLTGAQGANEGAGSSFGRVFNAGKLGAAQSQGGESVKLAQAQSTIDGVKSLIGNDSTTGITAIDAIIGDVRNQIPNAKIQDFRAKLGALAQQVSSYNPSVAAQLTNFAGNGLGTASGTNIMAAINAAQQSIQEQQNAIPNYNGGGGNTSGSTGGSYAESWTL